MTAHVPLSVLDVVPISSGATPSTALSNTVDLAVRTEQAGYRRYWIGEHHLSPGIAGNWPALVASLVAAATERIRVGSGAVQLGHHTALSVVEQFGLLDALYPGRVDLGLGRSGGKIPKPPADSPRPPADHGYRVNGLYIPPKFVLPADSPAWDNIARLTELLLLPGAQTPSYTEHVGQVIALLRGTYRASDGAPVSAAPWEGADLRLWVLGSSAGESARLAGSLGLPFAVNYHVSPATVLEAVQGYRDAFEPSATLAEPYVLVSADVVVGPDDESAARLALPYARWVLGIRSTLHAMPFPSEEEAAAHEWTDADRALVADRVKTQFVGSPDTVAAKLGALLRATGADELMITTITHDHKDRVHSYELLADAWARQESR